MTDQTKAPWLEVVAHMWQHEETGRIGFVDRWQFENGFAVGNPRLRIIAHLVRLSTADKIIAGKDAEIERLKDDNADFLDVINAIGTPLGYDFSGGLAALVHGTIAGLRAEVERLTKERDAEIARNNPLRALVKSQEERIAYLAKNCRSLDEARVTLESERSANEALTLEVAQQAEQLGALQAKIDALMLEFCPDEMTPEQLSEWAKHQKPVCEHQAERIAALAKAREALSRIARAIESAECDFDTFDQCKEALAAIDALGQPEDKKGGA